MLTDRKQNINEYSRVKESNRKTSHTCKQILSDLCFQNSVEMKTFDKSRESGIKIQTTEIGIKEVKMKQALGFLQKKNDKQAEELIFLSTHIAEMKKQREEDLQFFKAEKDKSKRMQSTINNQSKTIADLKKKIEHSHTLNKEQEKKISDLQNKVFKMKEILRKKQCLVNELKEKSQEKGDIDEMMSKIKQEVKSLRQNYYKSKVHQDQLEQENQKLKAKVQQLTKELSYEAEKNWASDQMKRRLDQQCVELSQMYEESKKQNQKIQNQLKTIISEQSVEINRLRSATMKIQDLQVQQQVDKSVYWKQIVRILKQNILDRNIVRRLQNSIKDVIINMEESWNKILMHVVATSSL